MDLGLAGKVAIVTGSSRGIGRGIAARLAEEGANVVLCARGGDELDSAVRSINGPGRTIGIVADVATPEGATAVVAAAVDQLGGVDIVVNNVGGSGAKTFADMDAADLQAVLDKNVFPAVNVSHAALPSLRSRGGGVIAVISSIWGREGAAPELQRRQGCRDQPREGDGDGSGEGRRARVQRRAGIDAVPGRQLGASHPRRPRGDRSVHRA